MDSPKDEIHIDEAGARKLLEAFEKRNEEPCEHIWVTLKPCGAPSSPETYEPLIFCTMCGMEKPNENE